MWLVKLQPLTIKFLSVCWFLLYRKSMIKVKAQRILDLEIDWPLVPTGHFSYLITDGHWLAHFGAKMILQVHILEPKWFSGYIKSWYKKPCLAKFLTPRKTWCTLKMLLRNQSMSQLAKIFWISADTITFSGTASWHENTSYGWISHHSEVFFKNTRTWGKYMWKYLITRF